MNRAIKLLGLLALLAPLGVSAAEPAGSGGISLQMEVAKEVVETAEDGEQRRTLVSMDSAIPGDTVVYTINYTNDGSDPAENVVITDPIPEAVEYVAGSAFGAGADFTVSVDGGETWTSPADAVVVAEDGSERPADAADYTHLRWVLRNPVPPGGSGFVRFKAVVE